MWSDDQWNAIAILTFCGFISVDTFTNPHMSLYVGQPVVFIFFIVTFMMIKVGKCLWEIAIG